MTQQVEKHIGIPVEQHAVTFRGEDARNAQSGCLCWLQNYRNRLTILFVSLLVITLTGLGHQVPSVPYFFRTANRKGHYLHLVHCNVLMLALTTSHSYPLSAKISMRHGTGSGVKNLHSTTTPQSHGVPSMSGSNTSSSVSSRDIVFP